MTPRSHGSATEVVADPWHPLLIFEAVDVGDEFGGGFEEPLLAGAVPEGEPDGVGFEEF